MAKKTYDELGAEHDTLSESYLSSAAKAGPEVDQRVAWALFRGAWERTLELAGWTEDEFEDELSARVTAYFNHVDH